MAVPPHAAISPTAESAGAPVDARLEAAAAEAAAAATAAAAAAVRRSPSSLSAGGSSGNPESDSGIESTGSAWQLRDINVRQVLRCQMWITPAATLGPTIALGVIHWAVQPYQRPILLYDGGISYPFLEETIPAWAAVVVPLTLMLASLLAGEFLLLRKAHPSLAAAAAIALHFVLQLFTAFIVTTLMSEVSKNTVGRLRPDFLDRCQPQGIPDGPLTLPPQPGGEYFACANAKDEPSGRKGFVSGHAATAALFATYNCGYVLWTLLFRLRQRRQPVACASGSDGGRSAVWLQDATQTAGLYWCLLQICLAWGIGISRVIDNRHSPADVIGGFLLGTVIGIACVSKAILTAADVASNLACDELPAAALPPSASLQQLTAAAEPKVPHPPQEMPAGGETAAAGQMIADTV